MFAKFHISNLITYLGIAFGVLSVYFCFYKMVYSDTCYIRYALACLIISGICDMFDGKFARLFKRTDEEKEIGVELDSLADTFCFLIVPVVFIFSFGLVNIISITICTIFVLCGISRLASYNIITADKEKSITSYQGLPVTSTAVTFPLLGLFRNFIEPTTFMYLFLVVLFITSILMIVNIKIPKWKDPAYIIIPILAIVLIILLILL